MVRPKDIWKFLGLKAFGVVEPLLDYAKECYICDLHLTVDLGMSRGRKVVLDTKFYTEFLVPSIVKLLAIVADDDLRDPKPADDGLSCEVTDILLDNLCQGLSFYPLGEVVDSYH